MMIELSVAKSFTLLCKVPSKVSLCSSFNLDLLSMYEARETRISLKSSKEWLRYKKTCILNKLNHKIQVHTKVCNENEVLKNVKFEKSSLNYTFQKLIGTHQDQTSSIKALYNKGIHTIVIT